MPARHAGNGVLTRARVDDSNVPCPTGFGKHIDRSSVCYDEGRSVVVKIVDRCPAPLLAWGWRVGLHHGTIQLGSGLANPAPFHALYRICPSPTPNRMPIIQLPLCSSECLQQQALVLRRHEVRHLQIGSGSACQACRPVREQTP